MRRIEEEQLKIFYYFMLVDGKCTDEEIEKYDAICKAMGISLDDKNRIIEECDLAVDVSGPDNSERVNKVIKSLLEKEEDTRSGKLSYGLFGDWSRLNKDIEKKIHVIWNLVNLGYADMEYSEPEKKVVEFLIKYWEIDKELWLEMLDTAETMLALTKQKRWVKSISRSYDYISDVIEEIESDMKKLENAIQLTIENSARGI